MTPWPYAPHPHMFLEDSDNTPSWLAGYHFFWEEVGDRPESSNLDQQRGWDTAWMRCYGEGVKASLRWNTALQRRAHSGYVEPLESVNPYPRFSAAGEAWASGYDEERGL